MGRSTRMTRRRRRSTPWAEVSGIEPVLPGVSADCLGSKQKQKRVIKQRVSLMEKQRGTTVFPIARIRKIIKADKDLDMMTGEAVFMIAVATEYFIQHFMEEGLTKAQLDRRKLVTYKDLASVVSRSDEFDFLRDVIPMPIPMSEALELRRQKLLLDENPTLYEDSPAIPGENNHDDLPPLALSTNPLYPNAIVKRPPNTHAKTSQRTKAPPGPSAPKVVTGKNAPVCTSSTPHSLPTRGSSRRSLVTADAEASVQELRDEQAQSAEGQGAEDDEAMEVD
ncbi:histone-fold-containing protein [Papiliotrema laurentii]|uniref:Histone-fold-containing protein n=1 Tax=Papiliotrema laurentii TaxID=5418 RepID=A0AAD9CX29_PAPLA|nr:histone-fold-containing protein [Papiliotrema laurentii]